MDGDQFIISDEHLRIVRERLRAYERGEDPGDDWETVKARLGWHDDDPQLVELNKRIDQFEAGELESDPYEVVKARWAKKST